jgi:GNAT superfamily N-acetyltransferase
VWQGRAVDADVAIRDLSRDEFPRVGEIDRTERIEARFEQRGAELVARTGSFDASPWDPDGRGEHSVHSQLQALVFHADRGGIGLGAFSGKRLVGIGMVVPHIQPSIAQLAWLHVSHGFRAAGLGSRLAADLEQVARRAGDTEIVVSATPSENTVRFYMGRGYRPMAQPLPELVELEPEDIHMNKPL